MDQLTPYRTLVKEIFTRIAGLVNQSRQNGLEMLCVFDEERDHYLLVTTGWCGGRRIRGTTLFVRLREGKIWIEEDWTEDGITPQLLEAGVSKEDIVLAFHPPATRPFTGFAVA